MDWFPVVFIVFKVVVFGVGMFLAIKWHHDKDKQARAAKAAKATKATCSGEPPAAARGEDAQPPGA